MSLASRKLIQATADAAGEGAYVEDVFSTYLYTGNGSVQVIENGINLGDSNDGGSVYFDGSGTNNEIIVDNTSGDLDITKNGTWTLEFWIFLQASNLQHIVFFGDDVNAVGADYNSGSLRWKVRGATGPDVTATMSLNEWHHAAFVNTAGTLKLYLNGVLKDTESNLRSFDAFDSWNIGNSGGAYPTTGHVSNLRLVVGTAVYTTAFTPSTSPLTAISGTKLLTLQGDDPFVDNSGNSQTITESGYAKSFGPFTAAEGGEGGMVWLKSRSAATSHSLFDTERGATKELISDSTAVEAIDTNTLTAFNSNGFALSNDSNVNSNTKTYASWTFRKAPKFFDVVTYTGTGSAQTISHNLGVEPGCIITKRISPSANWAVYHRGVSSGGETGSLILNDTDTFSTSSSMWNNTAPTDTVFTVGSAPQTNGSGQSYVAYLFAHNDDDGEFGESSDQDIIKCGSFTGLGASTSLFVDLGFEPQWVLVKSTSASSNWWLFDSMRGMTVNGSSSTDAVLKLNSTDAEALSWGVDPAPTGFYAHWGTNDFIYIAIRRPMKTPEAGTEVFALQTQTPSGSDYVMADSSGFPIDWLITRRPTTTGNGFTTNRLTNNYFSPNTTAAQGTFTYGFDLMEGVSAVWNANLTNSFAFKRATGFFDVVAYSGDGSSTRTLNHNLGAIPELIIFKRRSSTAEWKVWSGDNTTDASYFLVLNSNQSEEQSSTSLDIVTSLSATEFTVKNATDGTTAGQLNRSTETYVSYLFATLAGVSKVGSYTGTGSNVDVDCGFSAGARFILIKRTDSTGDWYFWDSERGIVAGNDPYLLLNSTAVEVTSTDYVDPLSSGFTVTSSAPAALNASGGAYIYLAIA